MREAESLRGQFGGWNSNSRDSKLLRFAAIIKGNVIGGLASFVSNKAYEAIVRQRLPETIDHPYWLCFQRIVLGAVEAYLVPADGGKIDFIFDGQGEGYERRAALLHHEWEEALATPFGTFLGKLSFHDDRDMVPLQAADMLAWHVRRHAESMLLGNQESRPVADVLWSIPTPSRPWQPQEMGDFVRRYQEMHPDSPVNRPDLHSSRKSSNSQ
jgi:hypothetical protein